MVIVIRMKMSSYLRHFRGEPVFSYLRIGRGTHHFRKICDTSFGAKICTVFFFGCYFKQEGETFHKKSFFQFFKEILRCKARYKQEISLDIIRKLYIKVIIEKFAKMRTILLSSFARVTYLPPFVIRDM